MFDFDSFQLYIFVIMWRFRCWDGMKMVFQWMDLSSFFVVWSTYAAPAVCWIHFSCMDGWSTFQCRCFLSWIWYIFCCECLTHAIETGRGVSPSTSLIKTNHRSYNVMKGLHSGIFFGFSGETRRRRRKKTILKLQTLQTRSISWNLIPTLCFFFFFINSIEMPLKCHCVPIIVHHNMPFETISSC